MTASLAIRRVEPADVERVRELHEVAMRDAGSFVEGAPESDLRDIQSSYLRAGGVFLVGERAGEIVAMGAYRPSDGYVTDFLDGLPDRMATLKRMRVDPAHQRQGYGQQLYDALEARAREAGFSGFVLDTTPRQTAARAFYEANSFEQVHRTDVELGDKSLTLLFYQKGFENTD